MILQVIQYIERGASLGGATERTSKMIFFNVCQNAQRIALYFMFAHGEHALMATSKHATTIYHFFYIQAMI